MNELEEEINIIIPHFISKNLFKLKEINSQ